MDGDIVVGIPVTPEAAEVLRDEGRAKAVGQFLSRLLRGTDGGADALKDSIAELKTEVRSNGLTDEMVDAELAAYNAERRL